MSSRVRFHFPRMAAPARMPKRLPPHILKISASFFALARSTFPLYVVDFVSPQSSSLSLLSLLSLSNSTAAAPPIRTQPTAVWYMPKKCCMSKCGSLSFSNPTCGTRMAITARAERISTHDAPQPGPLCVRHECGFSCRCRVSRDHHLCTRSVQT